MRILFTTNPLYGHLYPMLPLMNAARQADHEVIVATGPDFAPEVQRHGFQVWMVGQQRHRCGFTRLPRMRIRGWMSCSGVWKLARDSSAVPALPERAI